MSKRVLEVENLTVDIPVGSGMLHAVQGISFHVDQGETLCIVGESGCGKSLTSLAVMDLLPKKAIRTADKLALEGEDMLGAGERRMSDIRGNTMGMIFQEPMTSLNPAYTIGNQMEEALKRHRKVSTREARDRAIYLLEKVGITAAESRLTQYPHQLSGGLRQRVMIAMTLMCGPNLIIADEPTTALDVTIQAQILLLLAELQREFNMGLILITHDLGVVARIADRVAVMYAGQVVEEGTADQVFNRPTHPYTQGLLDCIPIPGKTERNKPLGSIPGIVPSLVGPFHSCHFAERCTYAMDACTQGDIDMRDAEETGHQYRCLLDPDACRANAVRKGVA
ncbi:MAG: ABC transporter ATP-binding protein [Rhodospirillales bacterium]